MSKLTQTIARKEGIPELEAQERLKEVRDEFYERLGNGEMPFDIMEEHFGLEPDYLEDLIG